MGGVHLVQRVEQRSLRVLCLQLWVQLPNHVLQGAEIDGFGGGGGRRCQRRGRRGDAQAAVLVRKSTAGGVHGGGQRGSVVGGEPCLDTRLGVGQGGGKRAVGVGQRDALECFGCRLHIVVVGGLVGQQWDVVGVASACEIGQNVEHDQIQASIWVAVCGCCSAVGVIVCGGCGPRHWDK